MGGGGGIQSSGVKRSKRWRGVQEAAGLWARMPTVRGYPVDQTKGLRGSVEGQGSVE